VSISRVRVYIINVGRQGDAIADDIYGNKVCEWIANKIKRTRKHNFSEM